MLDRDGMTGSSRAFLQGMRGYAPLLVVFNKRVHSHSWVRRRSAAAWAVVEWCGFVPHRAYDYYEVTKVVQE